MHTLSPTKIHTTADFDWQAARLLAGGLCPSPLATLLAAAHQAGIGLTGLVNPFVKIVDDDLTPERELMFLTVGYVSPALWPQRLRLHQWARRAIVSASCDPVSILPYCAHLASEVGRVVLIEGAGEHWHAWAQEFHDAGVPTEFTTVDWLLPNVTALVPN